MTKITLKNKTNLVSFDSTHVIKCAIEAAHKKGSGSTKNGRDSLSKRRGVKVYGGQAITAGGIIVRQVGKTFHPGRNVGCGKDYTLFALSEGTVKFERSQGRKCVSILPINKIENKTMSNDPHQTHNKPTRRERKLGLRTSIKIEYEPSLI